jgi:hypothetical protein
MNCTEGILVQAVHDNTLRLEVTFRFSGQGRDLSDGENVRRNLKRHNVLNSLCANGVDCTPKDWTIESKIPCQAEDVRHAIYESLRARNLPSSLGGWRLALDSAPLGEQLPIVAGGSAPRPAGGGTVSGGGEAAVGGRVVPANYFDICT